MIRSRLLLMLARRGDGLNPAFAVAPSFGNTPWCLDAAGIYTAGAQRAGVYVAGSERNQTYTAGAEAGQAGC